MAGLLVTASAAAVRLLDEGLPDPGLTDVAVWAGVWAMAYCLLYLACKREGAEWAIHLHAFLHACVSLGLSHYACFVKGPWVLGKQELGQANTPTQNLVMMISFGYFVFDFAWCMAMGSEPLMTFLHHVASGCGLGGSLFLQLSGLEMIATLGGAELSNPFYKVRYFLKATDQYNTPFSAVNDVLFALSFLTVRLVLGSAVLYKSIKEWSLHWFIFTGAVGLYLVSAIWGAQIVLMLLRSLKSVRNEGLNGKKGATKLGAARDQKKAA